MCELLNVEKTFSRFYKLVLESQCLVKIDTIIKMNYSFLVQSVITVII